MKVFKIGAIEKITREYIDQLISRDMRHVNRMASPFDHFDHDDGRNDEFVR